jgi:MYXO-CTERM domain-containing protein
VLRVRVVAVLLVSVLASCSPSSPEGPSAAAPLAARAAALTDLAPVTLQWSGGSSTCLLCDTPAHYACLTQNDSGWSKTFTDPVPAGYLLVGVKAEVYGASIGGGMKTTVTVKLNPASPNALNLGSFVRNTRNTCSTGQCDTTPVPTLTATDPTNNAGIAGYTYGGTNTLKLEPDDSNYCASHVVLTLTVAQRQIQVTPSSLSFGNRKKSTTTTKTVRVTNMGDAVLNVSGVTATAPYTVSPTLPFQVPSGGGQDLTVTFAPTALGQLQSNLSIASDDPANPTKLVPLDGFGVASAADPVPGALAFGEAVANGPGVTKTVTVNNVGNASFHITPALGGADSALFSVTPSADDVPANGSKSFTVTFLPVSSVAATASLNFTTDEAGAPAVPSVSLTGTGVQPTIQVPPALSFADVLVNNNAPATLTVMNSGTGTLNVSNIVKGGPGAGAYTFTPSTLAILAGQSAQLSVTFAPTVAGTANATLTLTTNDTANPSVVVNVTGRGIAPVATVPGLMAFGDLQKGTSTTLPLTVTNSGTGTLTVSNIVKGGTDPSLFSFTPATLTVLEGQSQDVTVTFSPTTQASASATLTLTTNDAAHSSIVVSLTGRGVNPTITVASPLAFGDQQTGGSKTLPLTVTNNGTGALTITGITKGGTNPTLFSFTPATLTVLEGQSGTVTVTFSPTALGAASATLTLATNDVAKASVVVTLTGRGVNPTATVGSTLAFGDQQLNVGTTLPLTVTNNGTGALNISNIVKGGTTPGPYTFTPATLTVLEGQSGTVMVTFTPTSGGAANATLTLTTNDVANASIVVSLTGRGIAPAATVPATLAFGDLQKGTSTPRPLTVTNSGTGTLTISNIVKGGTNGALFTFTPATLTVLEGQSQDVTVTFSPTAAASASATLTLTTNDVARGTIVVNLTGRGVNPTITVASPLAFSEQQMGGSKTLPLTVTNNGTGALTITGITKGGADPTLFSFTPATLTVLESQSGTVMVTFSPTALGAASATLTLATNDVAKPSVVVNLTGQGVNPTATVVSALPFGDQQINASKTLPLTVTNNGVGTLNVSNIVKGGTTPGAYSFTPATLTVLEGQSQNITVTFNPTVQGTASATLTLTTNDTANASIVVSLTGRGINPTATVGSPLAFGDLQKGTSTTLPLTVTNSGTGTLTISNIVKGGANGALFSFTPATLTVLEGQSQDVTVTFSPTAAASASATLTLTTNDVARGTIVVNLTGRGVNPTATVGSTLAFGDQQINVPRTLPLTVTNNGTGALNISSIIKGGTTPEAYSFAPATLTVLEGQSGTVMVTFNPAVEGAANATLTLTTNDVAKASIVVNLTGKGINPVITVPGPVAFGDLQTGTTTTRPLTVTNAGTGTLTVSNIVKGGTNPGAFSFSPATLTVLEGQSADVTVTFNPAAQGALSATLTLTTSDVARPTVVVSLTGRGVNPTATVPASIAFGDQQINVPRTLPLTVTNNGTGTLNVSNIAKGGTNAAAFSFSPATLTVLEGQSLDVTVTFTTTTQAAASATLTLTTNDVARNSIVVNLTGRGVNPIASVPGSVAFGDQRVGAAPTTKTLTVTNGGTGALLVTSIVKTGAGASAYTFTPASLTVAEGSSQNVTVTFTPTVQGAADATLTLTTNDVNPARSTVVVTLSGNGVVPAVSVPSVLPFGEVQVNTSAQLPLTITNSGSGAIVISNITKGGTNPGFYSFTPSSLTVPEGQSGVVTVTFNPTSQGTTDATLTLTTNEVARPTITVSLTGRGVNPAISVQGTLAFGEQQVNASATKTIAVTNSGTGTLNISNIVKSGPGGAFYNFSPSSLSVLEGQSQNITVTFSPSNESQADATLTLSTNDVLRSTLNVTLSGTGVNPIIVMPPTLAFGDVLVNSVPPPTLQLVISNTGSGTLHISNPVRSGSGSSFYSVSPSTLDVGAGQSKPLTVTFNPTVEGQADAVLTLTTNDVAKQTVNVSLSGYGGRPLITVSPTALDFQGVRKGTTKPLTVTIKNVGRAPLNIPSTPFVTPAAGAFSYVGPASLTINPGAQFDIQVSFAPIATSNYSGTLTIPSNAPSSPTTLGLTGFGADPQLSVSPSSIFFGDVRVGDASAPQNVTITVTNASGPTDVLLESLPVVGAFVATPNPAAPLPAIIHSGSSYTFTVKFKPTQPSVNGAATGSVTVTTALLDKPTVTLSGNGTVSKVETSVAALSFGSQRVMEKSGSQPIILSNKGAAELVISQLIFSDASFSLEGQTLPTEDNPLRVAAGGQKALSVAFTPAILGAAAGKLFIISNAFDPANALDLSGKGVDGQMSLTPSVVSFGTADVGGTGTPQSVELKNTGEYPLTIGMVDPPGDGQFAVSGLPNGLVLQPLEKWPFTVTFAPTSRGYSTSSAVIHSNAVTNKLFSLAVTGTGVAAEGELQPVDLTFGGSNVGVPVTKDISVKNIGEKSLSVSNIAFENLGSPAPDAALDFSLDGTVALPLVVDPGKSMLVRLKFTPREAGARQAKARFFTNAGSKVADMGGVGTSPTLKLTPIDIKFTNVLVGNASAPQSVAITNTGSGPLTLSSIKLVGTDAASFLMTPPQLPLTLLPQASASVSVSLKPDEERLFSAQIQMLSTDATAPTSTVTLSGAGVGQQIQLSETSLEFGNQLLNKPSSQRTVRVTNNGDTTITLAGVSVEGDGSTQFTLTKPTLPIDLKPRESQSVSVSFTPLAETDVNCRLKLSLSTPVPREVTLHGRGIPSVLEGKPSLLDFGSVRVNRPHPASIEIINRSSETIVLAKPVLTSRGGDQGFFQFDPDSVAGRALPPGASLIVALNYLPTVEALSEATLSFDTVPAQPRTFDIALSAKATQRLLAVDPGSLDFGRVEVGEAVVPQEITVVNRSSKEQWVVVKLKTVEGVHYTLDTKELDSKPIPAEASATFKVSFDPEKAGEETNEVQVWLQNETEPEVEIPVTGHGRQLTGQGSGCSSASTNAGSTGVVALAALVGLVALGSRRRRREETDGR